jgi:hypothetical protein
MWIDVQNKTPYHRNNVLLYDGVNINFGYNMLPSSHQNEFYILGYNEVFKNLVTHWMELPPPPTSHNSEYADTPTASPKLPSLEDVNEYINTDGNGLVPSDWIERVYNIIKKLGNFA